MSGLTIGSFVGRYRVDAQVGRGGFGEVYRGFDPQLGRRVALKVLRDDRDTDDESKIEASARFAREAKMAASFVSPFFCALFEVLERPDGEPVLVLEWIEGRTLHERIRDTTTVVSIQQRLAWLTDLARGLAEAHAHGIAHRDFKPGNVIVTSKETIKIVDFGLAKRVAAPYETPSPMMATSGFETDTGTLLGTERYWAPEQAASGFFDERTDQFSWGIVAYEVLAGTHPIEATPTRDLPATLPPPLSKVDPSVWKIVERALSFLPAARHASMATVVRLLDAAATTVAAAPKPAPTRVRPLVAPQEQPKQLQPKQGEPTQKRRSMVFVASMGVTLLVAVATLAMLLGYLRKEPSNRETPVVPVVTVSASPTPTVPSIVDDAGERAPLVVHAEDASSPAPKKVSPTNGPTPRTVSFHLRGEGAVGTSTPGPVYDDEGLKAWLRSLRSSVERCYVRPDFDGDDRDIMISIKEIKNRRAGRIDLSWGTKPNIGACIKSVFSGSTFPIPANPDAMTDLAIELSVKKE